VKSQGVQKQLSAVVCRGNHTNLLGRDWFCYILLHTV
jgi:hypothetical protein